MRTAPRGIECFSCHHYGSERFDRNGWECYCRCHTVADAAPELLAALEGLIANVGDARLHAETDAAIAAIAKAKGETT
jgi:hypothetical protein